MFDAEKEWINFGEYLCSMWSQAAIYNVSRFPSNLLPYMLDIDYGFENITENKSKIFLSFLISIRLEIVPTFIYRHVGKL